MTRRPPSAPVLFDAVHLLLEDLYLLAASGVDWVEGVPTVVLPVSERAAQPLTRNQWCERWGEALRYYTVEPEHSEASYERLRIWHDRWVETGLSRRVFVDWAAACARVFNQRITSPPSVESMHLEKQLAVNWGVNLTIGLLPAVGDWLVRSRPDFMIVSADLRERPEDYRDLLRTLR